MTTTISAALSPTESIVLSAAAATLRRPPTPEDIDAPLALLGADSLGIIELTAALEHATGITLPPDLAHESATMRELAGWIGQQTPATAGAALAIASDPFAQMIADSVLPDDVRPGAAGSCGELLEGRAILLTGATGFLGARLAADLLARSGARLYCTVRAGAGAPGARLRRRLWENGAAGDAIDGRVEIIEADLTRPRLGIPAAAWAAIGDSIDQIVHVGASVNWIAPYASLRAANVAGTLELLRLACRSTPIPFHFVSSLSACYAVNGPPQVDERFDPLPHVRGVHLGYAQTKVVAEALVREAGRRGLPVKIYRPSLISGHSRTGAFNPDDLLSLLVRGCIRMGTAPDLDWSLDCEPVDVVSAEILALSRGPEVNAHLTHRRPRHWRECLLWMRLAGYSVRLVPHADWLIALDRATASDADHPLRPLRSFFLARPKGAGGKTIPELYEDGCRTRATAAATDARLAGAVERPELDAPLLDCYFGAYRAAGYLPSPLTPAEPTLPRTTPAIDAAFFEAALSFRGEAAKVRSATRLSAGSEHSIVSELTAWRSRLPAGIFRYRLELDAECGLRTLNVVLKLKPHGDEVAAVGEAVGRLVDDRVGEAYSRWRDRLGFAGSHLRERAIYESGDDRLTRHMPALLGAIDLDRRGACALVLEDVSGARLIDSVDRQPWWGAEDIAIAIDGLAEVHAASYGTTASLQEQPWIGFRQSAASMGEMSDLWVALACHAAPVFGQWGGTDLPTLHRTLIDSIAGWSPAMDAGALAVVHNDFNPRNLCLRNTAERLTLCAYDWELATIGLPQRDLAELLCFVLPASVPDQTIDRWVERHRAALDGAAGVEIDRRLWWRGFAAAMNELLVNRLSFYALVHRIRRQSFLPRVVASWRRIHERTARMATG